jgi:hypothetical protein
MHRGLIKISNALYKSETVILDKVKLHDQCTNWLTLGDRKSDT